MNTQSCALPSLFFAAMEAGTTVTVSDYDVFKGSSFSLAFFCVCVCASAPGGGRETLPHHLGTQQLLEQEGGELLSLALFSASQQK